MFCPEGDTGGGGGGGDKGDKSKTGDGDKGETVSKKDFDELKSQLEALKKSAAPNDPNKKTEEDPDLAKKAAATRAAEEKNKNDAKALEASIMFNLNSEKWMKDNAGLLPKNIADIFKQAEKETFASATDKADSIKASVIKEFFSQQSNLDLLTPGVKSALEDFLKLTQDGRKEKARATWDQIFEPSFEMLRRLKKAEALGKGLGDGTDEAYKNKLIKGSRKHHLGEKENA